MDTNAHERCSGPRPGGRFASRRARSGFSFIEVLLATLVVGTVLVAATSSITGSVQAKHILVGEPGIALGLAREIHTVAQVLPRDAGDGVAATVGSEVAVLDDLDGATFSPPLAANLASLSQSAGWSQQVAIDTVTLAAPDQLATSADGSAVLLRLTVTVREGASVVGSYTWWLNP